MLFTQTKEKAMTDQPCNAVSTRRQFFAAMGAAGVAAVAAPTMAVEPGNDQLFTFQRQIPVESGYDVVVLGGGPGGCGAAIAAGRLGAKVLLVESGCMLGGMGTAGFVSSWYDMSDGERQLCCGIVEELVDEMAQRGGLRPGSPVAIAGVEVGRIKSIALEDYEAKITLSIHKDVALQKDAIASIKTKGLIGEKFIEITPGAEDDIIAPGGRLINTEPAMDIESLISKFIQGNISDPPTETQPTP